MWIQSFLSAVKEYCLCDQFENQVVRCVDYRVGYNEARS
jgi:hypothetical protein